MATAYFSAAECKDGVDLKSCRLWRRSGYIEAIYSVTKDGTRIYLKDCGSGTPVMFSHGWPLSSDAGMQMLCQGQHGYRVIAHDRRGCSEQSWNDNDTDTYADDLAKIVDVLHLKGVMFVRHSTGGGEMARYLGAVMAPLGPPGWCAATWHQSPSA